MNAPPTGDVVAQRQRARSRPRPTRQAVAVAVVLLVGVAVLMYPSAASWFSDRAQASEVTGYAETVAGVPDATRTALLEAARSYNADLPRGPLRNPFRPDGVAQETAVGDFTQEYFSQLAFAGTETMGSLSIPTIGVDLPILHGTDESTLARGVGHLFGTSLPVGGASTHSVLTAHSGFVSATLFDDLDELVVGDAFTVTVLGESATYRVDQIRVVLPDDSQELAVIDGEDHVTLVTCTPTGVNTHRLLVRGTRVEDTVAAESGATTLPGRVSHAEPPWWALALGGAAVAALVIVRSSRRDPHL